MRALKGLVIGMGILIVLGMIAMAVILHQRLSQGGESAAPDGFGSVTVPMPEGARLIGQTAAGERLVLDLVLADGTRSLVVLDLETGREIGRVALTGLRPPRD